MQDIKELNLAQLEEKLSGWGSPKYYAREIFGWIYQKGAADFAGMSNLPAGLRVKLAGNFKVFSARLAHLQESTDGTTKFLFELGDKHLIEAVKIPVKDRTTGCISSQAGCKYACSFCASGLKGFKRNLTTAEILEQVLYLKNNIQGGHPAEKERPVRASAQKLTHIVFMGTGEPLDNYENVMAAVRLLNSPRAFNIGARRITISTCGIIPGIKRLEKEDLQIELSISLHASSDKLRSQLMPVNSKYPLKELIACCREYIAKTNRQITFEYILIRNLNAQAKDAKELAGLLKNLKLAKVNLIPANMVDEQNLQAPDKVQVDAFKASLIRDGVQVTLRRERGQDIAAACGQLRLKYEKN